uniref:WD repeat, SAM and U-box domain-containing protein 1 n=1 Tax=Plectus sambesii TaxID=2011161 RepID=A0A914UTW8_9BILA
MSSIELLETISVRHGDVLCCAFAGEGRLLAVGSGDKLVRLFSFDSDDASIFSELPQSPLCGHSFAVYGCSFSPAGHLLVSCSQDGRAIIWDSCTGRRLGQVCHESQVALRVCQISPDGKLLATGSDDETAAFWNLQSHELIRSLEGHESSVAALAFTPDSAFLLTGSSVGELRMWDARYGLGQHMALEREAHDLGVTCAAFSPVATSTAAVAAAVDCDAPPSPSPKSHTTYLLATGGNDDLVKLWHVRSPHPAKVVFEQYASLEGHTHNVMCVAFSASGSMLASGGGDKCVIVWDPVKASQLRRLNYHQRYVTSVAFSADSRLLVSGSNDKHVAVWRIGHELSQDASSFSLLSLDARDDVVEDPFPPFNANKPVEDWNADDVCAWLARSLKTNEYGDRFRANSIDGQELLLLTDTMLKNALGIESLGHRNRILRGIRQLREGVSPAALIASSLNDDEVPHEFRCPITHDVMLDPVIAADGYTYERRAITDWMRKGHRTSPMTNALLPHADLTPNRMLKMLIQRNAAT